MKLLQLRIIDDWKSALKNKDAKKDALSMIITELKNRAIKDNVSIEEGRVCSDLAAQEVLQKMAKQRKEAIEAYNLAHRPELALKEQKELTVIESYLPAPLSDEELRAMLEQVIASVSATSLKEIGKVMGPAVKMAEGRADGKRIQAMIKEILGS